MARKPKDDELSKDAVEETGPAADAPEPDIEDAEVIEETPPESPVSGTDREREPTGEEDEGAASVVEAQPDASGDTGDLVDAARPAGEPEPDADGASAAEAQPEAPEARGPEEDGPPQAQEEPAMEAEPEQPEPAAQAQEPEKPDAAPPPPAPEGRSGIALLVPLLLGGAVAALLGFFAARYMEATRVVEGPTAAENAAAVSSLENRIAGLEGEVEALSSVDMQAIVEDAVAPLQGSLDAVSTRVSELEQRIDALSSRVETIALRPIGTGIESDEFDDALAQFRSQLDAAIGEAQTEIARAREEAQRISEEAFDAEQAALARAAWSQLNAALGSGAPFAEPLGTLRELTGTEIPDVLASRAEAGVPTLSELQLGFPEASRAALEASIRAETGGDAGDRFWSFIRVQTGARSLAPREGDDPDAILSRAEARLKDGDIEGALAELETLPEPGLDALSDWIERARTRVAATGAVSALSDSLNTN